MEGEQKTKSYSRTYSREYTRDQIVLWGDIQWSYMC